MVDVAVDRSLAWHQHPSAAALFRELRNMRRDAELRHAFGFDPALGAKAVPSEDVFDRLPAAVTGHQNLVLEIFDALVAQIKRKHPIIAVHGQEMAADKGYDSAENRAALFDTS